MKIGSAQPLSQGEMRPRSKAGAKRGFWPMRDIPILVWLILAVVAVLVHRELPMPRWLMIHLVFLGAITHAIFVWSQYFSFALLRTGATFAQRRTQNWRLALVNLGAVLVLLSVPLHVRSLTLAGAAAIIAGAVWHAGSIISRLRGSLPGKFGRTVYFYVAAAVMLIIGAGLGAWLAVVGSSATLVLAHAILNVFGWIGLTVAGTVVTLWPTILRTQADSFAPVGAVRAMPVLAAAVLAAALGAALSSYLLLVAGLLGYLAGLITIGFSLARVMRQARPRSFAALSVGMALMWWVGSVAVILVAVISKWLSGDSLPGVLATMNAVVPYLVAGFALQVLFGALSYLVPVVIGGGPVPVWAGTVEFERLGVLRVTVANAALIAGALPVSGLAKMFASGLYILAMASFIPIMLVAMNSQRRAKKQLKHQGRGALPSVAARNEMAAHPKTGQAIAGLLAVVLALAIAAAISPLS